MTTTDAQSNRAQAVDRALRAMNTLACIGVPEDPDSDAWNVTRFFQDEGCTVVPIHPTELAVLGEKVYRRLTEVPAELDVDTVLCFVDPAGENFAAVVGDVAGRAGLIAFWLHDGQIPAGAAEVLRSAGVTVFAGLNIIDEYQSRMDG